MSLIKLHFQPKNGSCYHFEIIYCLLMCMFRAMFNRHERSQGHCRYCCILKPADQDQHVRPFLETHPKQDVILLFLLQCVCICFMPNVFVCTVWVHACTSDCVCSVTVAVFLGVRRGVLCSELRLTFV